MKTLEEVCKDHIVEVLRNYPKRADAARILGLTRMRLYKRMKKFGLTRTIKKSQGDECQSQDQTQTLPSSHAL